MKKINRIITLTLVITLALGAIVGCGTKKDSSNKTDSNSKTEKTTSEENENQQVKEKGKNSKVPLKSSNITVHWGDQYGYYLLPIILEKKWFEEVFEKNNIKIKVSQFGSGPEMIEAFTTGAVDLGVMGVQPTISGKVNGAEITTIAAFDDASKASVIATPSNSGIKSVKDLKGKNVGVALGTIFHSHLIWALNQAGIDKSEVNLVNIDWSGVGGIVEQGEVDAAVGDYSDFYNTSLTDNFKFTYLGDATGSGTQDQVVVGRNKFIEEHPDVAANILLLLQKAANFIDTNHEEAVKINAKYWGVDKATIETALQTNDFGIYGGDAFKKNYDKYIQFMYDNELVADRINVDSVLNYSVLDLTGLAK